MFGIWKKRKPIVYEHKCALVLDFRTSTKDFYADIEKDLAERNLTGLEISRIEHAEGGILSANREYLRMRRERLVFDICSAPFGTTWLFSWRFSEIPFSLRVWEILVMAALLAACVCLYGILFGWVLGSILMGASFLSVVLLMRNTIALGLQDLDAALLQIPVVGAFYEAFFRADTYYREDTRHAYIEIVGKIVREKIDEVTAANGAKLVEYKDVVAPAHAALRRVISDLARLGIR